MADLGERDRFFELSAEEISLINPNTKTLPTFRSRADAELAKRIYSRVPVLINGTKGHEGNPWGVQFLRMFDMSNDSGLFHTARRLQAEGLHRERPDWSNSARERWVPLYEAKMVHHYDRRWATYDEENIGDDDARRPSSVEQAEPSFEIRPRYWVPEREVLLRIADLPKPLLEALRTRDQSFIALIMTHLVFGHWLVHGGVGSLHREALPGLYSLWIAFVGAILSPAGSRRRAWA
jgi:hypothetical protein